MKLIFFIFLFFSYSAYGEVINIDNQKLKKLISDGIIIVDIRTKKEWKTTGIIDKSNTISLLDEKERFSIKNWYKKFSKLKLKNNSVVIICAVGGRSFYISKLINIKQGNLKIYNLKLGIQKWISENNPVSEYR